MNKKVYMLILSTLILVSSLALAADLDITGLASSYTTDPGTTLTKTFTINANKNFTTVSVTSIPSGVIFSPSSFPINVGENKTITFSIAIPQTKPYGTYLYNFTVGNSTITTSKITNLIINSVPKLELSLTGDVAMKKNATLTVKNTGNKNLTGIVLSYSPAIKDNSNVEATLLFSENNFDLNIAQEKQVTSTANIPDSMNVDTYLTTIMAKALDDTNATLSLEVLRDYCTEGATTTKIDITKISDQSSEDEWEWKPLDKVEIEVRLRNKLGDDEDFTVELDLYDPDKQEFRELDDNTIDVSIDDGKSETVTLTIEVPAEVESKTYRIYAKAYVEDDEEDFCNDLVDSKIYQEVKIKKESREVIVKELDIPSLVNCGSTNELSFKVYNIGKNDEDKVKVSISNKELGINLDSKSFGLDAEDSEKVQFSIQIPEDAEEKTYSLDVIAFYDYDDDDDTYDEKSEIKEVSLKVEGKCKIEEQLDVSISAILQTEAKAGEEMIIKTTLENTGLVETTYTLFVVDYDSFATLNRIEPSSLTIKPGQSKDALIYLNVKDDVSGDYLFNIKAVYDTESKKQDLSVSIQGKRAVITGGAIGAALKENWLIWLIVLVNIILIIAIILVARKIARS